MPKQGRWSLVDMAHCSSYPQTQQVQAVLQQSLERQSEQHVMVTMVTKTWFKTEFKTEVNVSIGLKPDLVFRLSFGLKT